MSAYIPDPLLGESLSLKKYTPADDLTHRAPTAPPPAARGADRGRTVRVLLLILALLLTSIALLVCARLFSNMSYLSRGCEGIPTDLVRACERRCRRYTKENREWSDGEVDEYCTRQCDEARRCERVAHNRRLALAAVVVLAVLCVLLLLAAALASR